MRSIFSITTNSHVPQGLAALNSLRATFNHDENKNTKYIIFTTDDIPYKANKIDGIDIVHIYNLNLPDCSALLNNASSRNLTQNEILQNVNIQDTVRWAIKPCLIEHLLSSYQETIYIDSDLYFINNISDIINSIQNIGLSPHFRPYGTTEVFGWMKDNNTIGDTNVFTDGYFNGGFLIAKNTPIALKAIDWWKRCCVSRCEINKELGFYVDQKYLDFMYMHFNNIDKINDLGCNIAEWNIYSYHISNITNKGFLINNTFLPRFFHFSGSHYKNHAIMNSFYKEYINLVQFYQNY